MPAPEPKPVSDSAVNESRCPDCTPLLAERAALRDALAAIADALAVPGGYDDESTAAREQRQAWREKLPARAVTVAGMAEAIIKAEPNLIPDHVRYLREQISKTSA